MFESWMRIEIVFRIVTSALQGLSRFTGRKYEDIRNDLTRDLYLTAPEAVEYGLIDKVVFVEGYQSKLNFPLKVLLPLERTEQDIKKYIGEDNRNFGRI